MNRTMLSSRQSLTGEVKVESLNVIYNRVSLLKSKNVSRKLINNNNFQSTQLTNQGNYNSNINRASKLDESIISTNSAVSKKKVLESKESDNIQTNFWQSETIMEKNRLQSAGSKERTEIQSQIQPNFRRKFVTSNNPLGNISKTIYSKLPLTNNKFQSNRVYLMTGFSKNSLNQNDLQKRNSVNNQKDLSQFKKRPLTSTIARQRISFRVNQSSKIKPRINIKKPVDTSIKKDNSNASFKSVNKSQKGSKKSLKGSKISIIKGDKRTTIYKKQIKKFQQLYELLSNVLSSIKLGIQQVQKAVSEYSNFIQSKQLSFIDDFIEEKESKLQKIVKTTRLHETLSICYLFLEIAQERLQDNQSYLVNFIGHSLSNLLLVIRLYILKERRAEYEKNDFQNALTQTQIISYGQELVSQNDILLRIQHNNQIITIIHKKLGRNNQKFQSCIQNFFKNAERQKNSCLLSAYYIFQFLSMHIHQLELFDISPTLQIAPQPYTPPAEKEYTLIIEPLGILQKKGKYRPYLNQFMKWACKNFDVVLWTWQLPVAVEQIFQFLSPYLISRLYRHHCRLQNDIFVKDLSRLGRNLQKTVIIDFDKRIFGGHLNNGIECRWRGNANDKNLLVLCEIFQQMINSATSIQDTLTFYAEQILSIRGY